MTKSVSVPKGHQARPSARLAVGPPNHPSVRPTVRPTAAVEAAANPLVETDDAAH